MKNRQKQMGFTLVELMVVIIIIGILVAIALPNMVNSQQRARIAALKTNAHTLQVVVEAYQVSHNHYPSSADAIEKLDAYQPFSNPFFPQYKDKAGTDGRGAWRTNDDGDILMPAGGLLNNCGDANVSKGLVIYVGLDGELAATTSFTSATGNNANTNPAEQYMIYGCDENGRTIPRFLLSTGKLTPAGASLLAGS